MTEHSENQMENQETSPSPANDSTPPDPMEALQNEVVALKDRLLRTAAEAENTRKRAQREAEETAKYAVTSLARDLVSVAENLKRALESIPAEKHADPAFKTLAEGVEMTQKELLGAFEKHGIRRIDPVGQPFDHNLHQAVVQIESPDHAAGTVVQVLQAGYVIHDRLLRPAMVGVAKQGEAQRKVDTSA